MGRHSSSPPPPWHCTWDPILEVFVEIPEQPDLTEYDHLVENTVKEPVYGEPNDQAMPQEPGSVVE